MIGGGGKIGRPPGVMPPVTQDSTPADAAKQSEAPGPVRPSDRFEKTQPPSRLAPGMAARPAALGHEVSASADLLRLARDNPAGARQLVATLAGQSASALAEVERELVAARALLEKLGRERFTKRARDESAQELRRQRERIAALKLRLTMCTRKMALLQQIAGKLGDPRLDEELDRLLSHHGKLKSDWGRRHHLLGLGGSLSCALDGTPEHLQGVVRTEVRAGSRGDEVCTELTEISPRRVIAEVIARTLDGSTRPEEDRDTAALRGEYGRSAQSYAMLTKISRAALAVDPFKED